MGPEGTRKDVPGDPRSGRAGIVGPGRTRKDQKFLEKQEGHHRRDRKEQEGHSWRSRRDIAVGRGATLLEDEEGRGYGTKRAAVPGGAGRDQEGHSQGCVAPGGGCHRAGAPEDTAAHREVAAR